MQHFFYPGPVAGHNHVRQAKFQLILGIYSYVAIARPPRHFLRHTVIPAKAGIHFSYTLQNPTTTSSHIKYSWKNKAKVQTCPGPATGERSRRRSKAKVTKHKTPSDVCVQKLRNNSAHPLSSIKTFSLSSTNHRKMYRITESVA